MSAETRQAVANNPKLVFTNQSFVTAEQQKNDILRTWEQGGVQSTVVAHIQWMLGKGYTIGITCLRTGHSVSTSKYGHNPAGCCYDGWLMNSTTPGDWAKAGTDLFYTYLRDIGLSEYARQTGLTGDGSDTPDCFHYAIKGYEQRNAYVSGQSVFQDSGSPHVHTGCWTD